MKKIPLPVIIISLLCLNVRGIFFTTKGYTTPARKIGSHYNIELIKFIYKPAVVTFIKKQVTLLNPAVIYMIYFAI